MGGRSKRSWFWLACAASAGTLVVGGCQKYERKPLDLSAHAAEFVSRGVDSEKVAQFAAGLAESGAGNDRRFDLSDGIGPAEAEVIALVFNAELRVARLRAGVAAASAAHAGLWEDPTLSVDLTRIIQSVEHPWKIAGSIGLTLPISGRLEIEKKRAGHAHSAELARVAAEEWRVRMDVRRAWAEWAAAAAEAEATRAYVSDAAEVLRVVDEMERGGEMARTEARLFRIEEATRRNELEALRTRVGLAELHLRGLMGLSPDAPIRLAGGGLGVAVETAARAAWELGPDELARRNPSMLIAAAEYEVAESALELEIRRQYPDVQIGPGYGREDGNDELLLGIGVPLPVWNGNRQRIAEARVEREAARAGAEGAMERVLAALHTARMRLDSAARQRAALESEVVPLVDAQHEDMRKIAELGEISTVVVLESLSRRHRAKLAVIQAHKEEAMAAIDLVELGGPEPAEPAGADAEGPSNE